MALAYLRHEGSFGNKHQFSFDIGQNVFYSLIVGNETQKRSKYGLTFVDDAYYQTPLTKVHLSALGKGKIQLSNQILKDKNAYVQLVSHADQQKNGTTYSDIIRLRRHMSLNNQPDETLMPALGFTNQQTMETTNILYSELTKKEEQYSDTMFIQGLLAAVPAVVSTAVPVIKSVIAGLGGASGVASIVGSLLASAGANASKQTVNNIQTAAKKAKGSDITSPEFVALIKMILENMPKSEKPKAPETIAKAQAAPAALLALLPLLQKVITPEVMKSIINTPDKMFNSIIDGAAKLNKQEMDHLERLNPGVDDPSIERILASMSLSMKSNEQAIKFKRTDRVELNYDLKGEHNVSAFMKDSTITIPLSINTPKTISRAIIQVIIKDAETLSVFAEKKFKQEQIQSDSPIEGIQFSPKELSKIPVNRNMLLCTSVIWKNTKGEKIGTYKKTLISFTSAYLFGFIKQAIGEPILLNDVVAHRNFWHKVWENDLDGKTKRALLSVKYYYQLEPDKQSNTQNKTRVKWDNPEQLGEERKITGKLKSGFEASLSVLNHILPQVSEYPSLSQVQLNALSAHYALSDITYLAAPKLLFKDKPTALWVFPELKIHEIILKKVSSVNSNGQPTAFTEEAVHFGIPSDLYFIGLGSKKS